MDAAADVDGYRDRQKSRSIFDTILEIPGESRGRVGDRGGAPGGPLTVIKTDKHRTKIEYDNVSYTPQQHLKVLWRSC